MKAVLASLGAVLTLAGVLPAGQERSLPERVQSVLASAAGPRDGPRVASELARLGPAALPVILARLAACPETELQTFAVLLGAVAEFPRPQILEQLASLSRSAAGERERIAGLQLLARLGSRAELALTLELGRAPEPEAPPGLELRTALERALRAILAREPGAARVLAEHFPSAPPATQTSIAAVLGGLREAGSTGLLAGLLGSAGPAADALLLLELGSAAERSGSEDDLLVFERVRDCFGKPDAALVVLACAAAADLGDHGAAPDLIMLLEHQDPNVRRAAHASLRSLTGLAHAAEAEPWLAWLDESLAWWDERAEACRIALVSGTPAEAAAALDECARQRLFAHDVAGLLALAVQRPEPDLAHAACRALRTLPARTATETLIALRAHPDPAVTECARAALEHARSGPRVAQRRPPALPRTNGRIQ